MNTRKDNNGQALRKWQATKPGHIARPLRFIREKIGARNRQYLDAESAARHGDGLFVQKVARRFL